MKLTRAEIFTQAYTKLIHGTIGSEQFFNIAWDAAKADSVHLAEPTETATDTRLADFRDTVLHQRGALAENGMTNDQVNDVLSEFDACFDTTPCQSAGAAASHECGSVLHMRDPFSTASMLINEWNEAPQDTDDWGNRAAAALGYLADQLHKEIIANLQSGISSPSHRPNEKDVIGEGKQ